MINLYPEIARFFFNYFFRGGRGGILQNIFCSLYKWFRLKVKRGGCRMRGLFGQEIVWMTDTERQ